MVCFEILRLSGRGAEDVWMDGAIDKETWGQDVKRERDEVNDARWVTGPSLPSLDRRSFRQ